MPVLIGRVVVSVIGGMIVVCVLYVEEDQERNGDGEAQEEDKLHAYVGAWMDASPSASSPDRQEVGNGPDNGYDRLFVSSDDVSDSHCAPWLSGDYFIYIQEVRHNWRPGSRNVGCENRSARLCCRWQ